MDLRIRGGVNIRLTRIEKNVGAAHPCGFPFGDDRKGRHYI